MLEFRATLRISSTKYTLEHLKSVLGEPTRGFSLGDSFSKDRKTREHTYWALESSRPPKDQIEFHLNELLDYVDARAVLFADLRDECDMDMFCLFSSDNGQGGAVLSSTVMERLFSYGFSLVFDVYAEA